MAGGERTAREAWLVEVLTRQQAVLERLRVSASSAAPAVAARWWLGVDRQARRYLRNLEPWSGGRGYSRCAPELADHAAVLQAFRAQAEALAGTAGKAGAEAERDLGVRVAFVGKGGAGKTFLAATLARLLARRGRMVLAVDLDTNPGLAYSLGLAPLEAGLPADAVEAHEGAAYGWQLASGLDPLDAVDRFATVGPDGVRYLGLGKIGTLDKEATKRSVVGLLEILLGFGHPEWDVVADLEAGPTTPFERYHTFADHVLVVVGPAWRSALTARRLLPMLGDVPVTVVANRVSNGADHPGLVPRARIPDDPLVTEAERLGIAPLDHCPDAPAMLRMADLVHLVTEEVPHEDRRHR